MSAAAALTDALVAALEADAALAALLGATAEDGRVYMGRAPDGAQPPYVTVGTSTEQPGGRAQSFGTRAFDGVEQIHGWTPGPDKRPALDLYGAVYAALDGAVLSVAGHALLTGRVSLVRTMPDPDDVAHHAVIEYRATTRRPR